MEVVLKAHLAEGFQCFFCLNDWKLLWDRKTKQALTSRYNTIPCNSLYIRFIVVHRSFYTRVRRNLVAECRASKLDRRLKSAANKREFTCQHDKGFFLRGDHYNDQYL